jgi:chromate reductase, NAD(P)H dehydrogenase (quinone)
MQGSSVNVRVLVGSLRAGSYSRRMAHVLAKLAPEPLALSTIEIGAMPLYNQDLEAAPPESWNAFRRDIKAADALLFVTPEYNRSIPSALKNAIDVGSRPKGAAVWTGKPAAVISVSPGVLGAFGANHHLRQCLMCLFVPTMPAPEAYIGGVDKLLTDDDDIGVAASREFLLQFMRAFADWVARFIPPATR